MSFIFSLFWYYEITISLPLFPNIFCYFPWIISWSCFYWKMVPPGRKVNNIINSFQALYLPSIPKLRITKIYAELMQHFLPSLNPTAAFSYPTRWQAVSKVTNKASAYPPLEGITHYPILKRKSLSFSLFPLLRENVSLMSSPPCWIRERIYFPLPQSPGLGCSKLS